VVNKKIIQNITSKEMDRKEFLKYSGIMLISLIGLRGIVNLFVPNNSKTDLYSQETSSHGFGSGKYGA